MHAISTAITVRRALDHVSLTYAAALVRTHGCAAVLTTEAHATAGAAL